MMSNENTGTCLSEKVRRILHPIPSQEDHRLDILTDHNFLNLNIVDHLINEGDDNYEYFLECSKKINIHLIEIANRYEKLTEGEIHDLCESYLAWTCLPKALEDCFHVLRHGKPVKYIQSLLISTSLLERSLGDVYLMKSSPCPSLLKDLLTTPELSDLFGLPMIKLLRVLIGPPTSLNLRNVAWHGFPRHDEIEPRHCYIILCIFLTLGKTLEDKGVKSEHIRHRQFTTFSQLRNTHPEICNSSIPSIEHLIMTSPFILKQMQPIVTAAFTEFTEQRYGVCVCLLLPQLETGIRRLFVKANNCPDRILTAENSTFFTTFDIMLASHIQDGSENKLRDLTGDSLMSLLLDILNYPDGPRIRDKISHGEADLITLDRGVATSLIYVFTAFSIFAAKLENVNIEMNNTLSSIETSSLKYESRFHPISVVKQKVRSLGTWLSGWVTIRRPNDGEIENYEEWNTSESLVEGSIQTTPRFDGVFRLENINMFLLPFTSLESQIVRILDIKINTVHRKADSQTHSREEEILKLHIRILSNLIEVSSQIKGVCNNRYDQWKDQKLRSRQRKTYVRMLNSIPPLSLCLRRVLLCIMMQLYGLDNMVNDSDANNIIRLLKQTLKFSENLISFTNEDKNKWDEAVASADTILKSVDEYMVQFSTGYVKQDNPGTSAQMAATNKRLYVSTLEELKSAGRKVVQLDGRDAVVFYTSRGVYALDKHCYHGGGPLEMGEIGDIEDNPCVKCPWHRYIICLENGEGLYQSIDPKNMSKPPEWRSKGYKQRTHKIYIDDNKVFIEQSQGGPEAASDYYYSDEYKEMMCIKVPQLNKR